ncbi:MAG TPA: sigma-70 family RNA polymerase sigma factor [Blastocatellia bacterium]|nr:sigma-70 family RNA polymerase sigma factor [Blastocatellia bacterium]
MSVSAKAYEDDRRLLWGLCYRMTGNASDAEDLVQETFVRALEKPPRRLDEPLRPWLVRVAMNLSRDHLRRRKVRGYAGEWLPSPVSTGEESLASYEPPAPSSDSPATRYDMVESVSFAFLLALEALTPSQRAVLILRDVFDYSTQETAEALGVSEASVKVMLHRARRRMRDYEGARIAPVASAGAGTRRAIDQFLYCLRTGDSEALERLLAEDVVSLSDGGGEVAAAMRPVRGRGKVMRLIKGLAKKGEGRSRISFRTLNGLPALVVETGLAQAGFASRFTLHFDVDRDGRIRGLFTVLAPRKLSALP